MLTRRSFVTGAAAFVGASCTRRKASGFSGFAFIANQDGEAVAALDLTAFAVARHIRLQGRPTGVAAHPNLPFVYVLTPENGTIHEIRTDTLALTRKLAVAGAALSMRLSPDGKFLYVLCRQPRCLLRFATAAFRVDGRVPLPAEPVDFDLDREGKQVAVSYGAFGRLSLFDALGGTVGAPVEAAGEINTLRFRSDSRALIAADVGGRMLSLYDTAKRELVVNLPLGLRPDHICANADGGQVFITGAGADCVVVVFPYYTPYVAETVLAGHAPGAMAASPQYLFVANRSSADVSILNIQKRHVVAVTPVGAGPNFITLTPDDQYALVLNQDSGDVAVIRVLNITRATADFKRSRKGPLFMMIPVGSKPVSAAVVAI